MSLKLYKSLLTIEMNSAEKNLLRVLVFYAREHKDYSCAVRIKYLQLATGFSRSFIFRLLKTLEEDKWLVRKRQLHRNKRTKENLYYINSEKILANSVLIKPWMARSGYSKSECNASEGAE